MVGLDPTTFRLGQDGFIWWIGIVESVLDPLNIGRVKARVIGWHQLSDPPTPGQPTPPDTLCTNDLPWSIPIRPVTHSHVPSDLRVRDWVFGFFLDGTLGQQPMILGVFPSIRQDTSTLNNNNG